MSCKPGILGKSGGSNLKGRLAVKNDRGKKIILTMVKTRIALMLDSAMIARYKGLTFLYMIKINLNWSKGPSPKSHTTTSSERRGGKKYVASDES